LRAIRKQGAEFTKAPLGEIDRHVRGYSAFVYLLGMIILGGVALFTEARDLDSISSWCFLLPALLVLFALEVKSYRLHRDIFTVFSVFLLISGSMIPITAFMQKLRPELNPVTTMAYYNGYVNYGLVTYILSILSIAFVYNLQVARRLGYTLPLIKQKAPAPLLVLWIIAFIGITVLALYMFIQRYSDYASFYFNLEDSRFGFGMYLFLIQAGGCAPPLLLAYCYHYRNWKILLIFLPVIWVCFLNPSRAYWLSVVGAALIYHHYMKKRIRPIVLGAAMFLFVPLALLIGQLRNTIPQGRSVTISWADEQAEDLAWEMQNFNNYLLVLENYPKHSPYYYGQMWLDIPIWFVPRQLWPEKPTVLSVLRLQDSLMGLGWEQTSFTYLSEFYANMGIPGIILGSLLTGLVFGIADVYNLRNRDNFNWILIYGWLVLPMMLFFSRLGFIALFANLLPAIPLATALFFPFRKLLPAQLPVAAKVTSEFQELSRSHWPAAGMPPKDRLG